jgi:hypothetical protein
MKNEHQLNLRLDAELYRLAKAKCKDQFGIGLAPLIKIFLRTFVTQRGVGFFVGDIDLKNIVSRWLTKKIFEKNRKRCSPLPGPRLRDLYDMP